MDGVDWLCEWRFLSLQAVPSFTSALRCLRKVLHSVLFIDLNQSNNSTGKRKKDTEQNDQGPSKGKKVHFVLLGG